jgi:hypothetical protein
VRSRMILLHVVSSMEIMESLLCTMPLWAESLWSQILYPGVKVPMLIISSAVLTCTRFAVKVHFWVGKLLYPWSRDSSVSIVTRLRVGRPGFHSR